MSLTSDKWDRRFLDMAKLVSAWSKDPSTKTGAVIVRPDRSVASVGFNGFPMKLIDTSNLYENRATKYSRIVHCEVNALIFAKEPVKGYTLYTYPFLSCDRCFVQMVQAGIVHFVAPVCPPHLVERWEPAFKLVRSYAAEAGVTITEVPYE